jgi:hypothetical protein
MSVTLRVGRSLGRTIYVHTEGERSEDDTVVGMVDSVALAQGLCEAFNKLDPRTREMIISDHWADWAGE